MRLPLLRLPRFRRPLLRVAVLPALLAAGACSFEPRYPVDPGAAPGRGVVMAEPAYPIDAPPSASAQPATPRYAPPATDEPVTDEPAAIPHARPPVESGDLPPPRADLDAPPRLVPAMDYLDAPPLLVLASTRQHALRKKIEPAEATAAKPSRRARGHARPRTGAGDETDAAPSANSVTVGKGDTLYSLSNRAHATVEAVAKLNGLKPPYALAPGRVLKLPSPKTYVARKGDTVEAVAGRYGVKESSLRKANPDLAGGTLKRGAKVVLPAAARDSGADDHAQGAAPPAAAARDEDAAAPSARDRRKAAADAATAALNAKAACRRSRHPKACLKAAAQTQVAAEASAARPSAADATAALDPDAACRRSRHPKACLKAAKQAAADEASARPSVADAAAAIDAKAACRHSRHPKACLKAATEQAATATDARAARKSAADAATAELNLKACLRRHSRRSCRAQAERTAFASAEAPAAAPIPRRSRTAASAAYIPTPPALAVPPIRSAAAEPSGSSAADIVASASLNGPIVTHPAARPLASTPAREAADVAVSASPGPRSYASVFGSPTAAVTSGRKVRDRSGRTSQDAQAAAAAAAKRGYARATIPPVVMPSSGDAAGRPRFMWPVSGEVLSGFGPKGSGLRNDGLDLAAQTGDPVRAAAAGDVVYAGGAIPGFGNLVLVKHPGGWVTAYGHLSKIAVAMRQAVRQGDVVGEAGQSGAVDRPEVHFEIRYAPSAEESAKPVDPAPLLPRRG